MLFGTRSPGRFAGISIGLVVFGLFSQPASGRADPAARVRGLNNDLLRLHSELGQGSRAKARLSGAKRRR